MKIWLKGPPKEADLLLDGYALCRRRRRASFVYLVLLCASAAQRRGKFIIANIFGCAPNDGLLPLVFFSRSKVIIAEPVSATLQNLLVAL